MVDVEVERRIEVASVINTYHMVCDDRGDDIITLIPYQEFKPTNGDYLKSRMPVSFKGGREVTVKAKSSTNLTAEFSFDLVFDIDQSITPE